MVSRPTGGRRGNALKTQLAQVQFVDEDVLTEISLENWAVWGCVPASEVDLGFKVNV